MKTWHKNNLIILVAFLTLQTALAQNVLFKRIDSGQPNDENIKKKPEALNLDEMFMTRDNSDFDLDKTKHYTGAEVSRIAASYHLGDKGLAAYDVIALRKIDDYAKHWLGFGLRQLKSGFSGISQNHDVSSTAPLTSEANQNNQRPLGANATLSSFMIGYGHRFRFVFAPLFDTKNLFETVQVYLTYNTMKDNFTGRSYQGPGLTMEYDVHNRVGTSFFYGAKFSYNMAQVSRGSLSSNESRSDRTLTLGFASLAFNLGFYY